MPGPESQSKEPSLFPVASRTPSGLQAELGLDALRQASSTALPFYPFYSEDRLFDSATLFLLEAPLWAFDSMAVIGLSLAKLNAICDVLTLACYALLFNDQELRAVKRELTREDLTVEKRNFLIEFRDTLTRRHQDTTIFFLLNRIRDYRRRQFGEDYQERIARLPTGHLAHDVYRREDFVLVANRFLLLQLSTFGDLIRLGYYTLTDIEYAKSLSRQFSNVERMDAFRRILGLNLNQAQCELLNRSQVAITLLWLGFPIEKVMSLGGVGCATLLYGYRSFIVYKNALTASQMTAISRVKSFDKVGGSSEIFLHLLNTCNLEQTLSGENGSGVFLYLMELLNSNEEPRLQALGGIPSLIRSASSNPYIIRPPENDHILENPLIWLLTITATFVRNIPERQHILFNFITTHAKANLFSVENTQRDIIMSYFWRIPAVLDALVQGNLELQTKIGIEVMSTFAFADSINHLKEGHDDDDIKRERLTLLSSLLHYNKTVQDIAAKAVCHYHSPIECFLKCTNKLKGDYSIEDLVFFLYHFMDQHVENRKILAKLGVALELINGFINDFKLFNESTATSIVLLWSLLSGDHKTQEVLMNVVCSGFVGVLLEGCKNKIDAKNTTITTEVVQLSAAGILNILSFNPNNVTLIRCQGGFEIMSNWEWKKSGSMKKDAAAFKLLRRDTESYALARQGLFSGSGATATTTSIEDGRRRAECHSDPDQREGEESSAMNEDLPSSLRRRTRTGSN